MKVVRENWPRLIAAFSAAALMAGTALLVHSSAHAGSTLAVGERVQVIADGKQATVLAAIDPSHVVLAFDGDAGAVLSYPDSSVEPVPSTTTTTTTTPTTTTVPTPPPPDSFMGFADTPPGADFRPYSPLSPFNQPIVNPTIAPQSEAIVKSALANGAGAFYSGANAAHDYAHPIYYARTTDPLVTLSVGSYAVNGSRIYVPALAQAAGGGDGHLAIVEPDGWEYDFWQASRPNATTLKASIGYRQRYDGLGVVTQAMTKTDPTLGGTTAPYFGLDAGMIRASELAAGHINHALFLVISCGSSDTSFGFGTQPPGASGRDGSGSFVFPAFKGDAACSGVRAPMGARFQLAMSDAAIDSSGAPAWERTEAHAMHSYGGYMGDTGGPGFSPMLEDSVMFTALGKPNPFAPIATATGIKFDSTYGYIFRPSGKIPWSVPCTTSVLTNCLRVIAPPVTP